ncbi:MAG: hypothetical protein Cons2KO_20630 [Congregibacter sp.]
MNDEEFHREQLGLLAAFAKTLKNTSELPGGETLANLAAQFDELVQRPADVMDEAPALVSRLLTTAPQLAEYFPRDLLWYLGGECLHFMPDEEIDRFSALDQQRRDAVENAEAFDWPSARANALGLQ